MYITVEDLKKHLNIDEDFTEDDGYLAYLITVAEDAISIHIDRNLSEVADENGGELPAVLIHAMKLFIGDMYQSRESTSFNGSPSEIPFSYTYLTSLYRRY